MHKSVAAIIINNGRILMVNRKQFPLGWACPAGHIDKNETPEQALARETKEETNLKITKYKLLFHEYIDWNICAGGVKGHDWYVYEIIKWQGKPKLNSREHEDLIWQNISEIQNLNLEPVWQYWFKKLNYL